MYKYTYLFLLFFISACAIKAPTEEAALPLSTVSEESYITDPSKLILRTSWRRFIGNGLRYLEARYRFVFDEENIYACNFRTLTAMRQENGEVLWQKNNDALWSGCLGQSKDRLYAGDEDGKVYRLQTNDSAALWRTELGSGVLHPPISHRGFVIVVTEDATAHLLRTSSGAVVFRMPGLNPDLTVYGMGTPVYANGNVYLALPDGHIISLNVSNGEVLWQARPSTPQGRSEVERIVDINADPLLVDNLLYAVSTQGSFFALNRIDGRIIWSQEFVAGRSSPVHAKGRIFTVDGRDFIHAFDARSGEILATQESLQGHGLLVPVIWQDKLITADSYGYLYTLNQQLQLMTRHYLSPYPIVALQRYGDYLYVLDAKGWLQRLELGAEPIAEDLENSIENEKPQQSNENQLEADL